MPWPTKQTYDDSNSLVLKKDQMVKVQLLQDEPELYYTHYNEADKKSTKCTAPDCDSCRAGLKRVEKGSMLVKDMADGAEKKLKGSAALFLTLHEILDMCGGRNGFIFSMKATGDKSARRYHIVPLPINGSAVSGPAAEDEETPF